MATATNDRVLIDQVLKRRQEERECPVPDSYAFELFSCEQALSEWDLSPDEIAEGVVGGGNDGGIDGVYVFLDGQLIGEDSETVTGRTAGGRTPHRPRLDLWLIQAKTTPSFTETAIEKVADSSRRLLDLDSDKSSLLKLYSTDLVTRIDIFRKAFLGLASRHPEVHIHFVYASRGDDTTINSKVTAKAEDLKRQFEEVSTGTTCGHIEFLGAGKLWSRYGQFPSYTLELVVQEQATANDSYVAVVPLKSFVEFLRDDSGGLHRHIFDWNVRDYQGAVEVNKEIQESLADSNAPEFWWLNNGVTIVCTEVTISGKRFTLDDVQIVNGLQTSRTVFDALHDAPDDHPAFKHSVLVRILRMDEDSAARDKVIRATNRQTSVPDAYLRATDPIQHKIESFFLQNDWFYDRRKNYYRNQGKNIDRIVGIPWLAQAVLAIALGRPNDSRARPTSLLKKDDTYRSIFSDSIPLATYLWIARAQKEVDAFLLSESEGGERTNLRYYVSAFAVARLVGIPVTEATKLTSLVENEVSIRSANLPKCLEIVRSEFEAMIQETGDNADKVAKGAGIVSSLMQRLSENPLCEDEDLESITEAS